MPATRSTDFELKQRTMRAIIKDRMAFNGLKSKNLAPKMRCAERTVPAYWRNPERIRMGQFWELVTALGLTDEEIIQIARGRRPSK